MKLKLICKEIFIEDSERNLYGFIPSDYISLYVDGEFIKLDKCIKLKRDEPIECNTHNKGAEFVGYGCSSIRTLYCEFDTENFDIERFVLVFANVSLNGKINECDCLSNYMYKTENGMIPLDFKLC